MAEKQMRLRVVLMVQTGRIISTGLNKITDLHRGRRHFAPDVLDRVRAIRLQFKELAFIHRKRFTIHRKLKFSVGNKHIFVDIAFTRQKLMST